MLSFDLWTKAFKKSADFISGFFERLFTYRGMNMPLRTQKLRYKGQSYPYAWKG